MSDERRPRHAQYLHDSGDDDFLYQKNDEIINSLPPPKVQDYHTLHRLIKNGEVHIWICDKESMVVFEASGFVWSLQGNLVICCER